MNTKSCSLTVGTLGVLLFVPQALAQSPAASDRAAVLADARAGRWEKIETPLVALTAVDPADVEANVLLAQHRLEQQRSKEAIALLERAVAAAPERPELHSQLGVALSHRIGEVSFVHQAIISSQMRSAFEKSVELDPHHVPGLIGLSRYFMNAPAIAGGSLEKAEEYARKVDPLDPFNGALSHGLICERGEKWKEAAEYFRQALALQGQHAWLHALRGSVLAREGRKPEAQTEFEAALKIQPDNVPARDGLAALTTRVP